MTVLVVLGGALLIGATLGLLGGGGTVLTVPLVHALLGLDTRHAIALSLPVVAVAAATGSVVAWRRGLLSLGPAVQLACATSAGAWVGAAIAQQLATRTQSLVLATTLLVAAVFLWLRRHVVRSRTQDTTARGRLLLLVTGVGVGVLTGVVGVGGGFLIVPALVMFGGYTALDAVPISLFAITFSAATAAVGYRTVPVAWGTVAVMAAAASSGVLAGGAIARRLNPAHLQAVFAVVLLGASGYIFLAR